MASGKIMARGKPLNVPWDKIREAVENGTQQVEVAKLFGIGLAAIRKRSQRESWRTPTRLAIQLDTATKSQGDRVAGNQSVLDQLKEREASKKLAETDTFYAKDVESLMKSYREKSAEKFYKIFSDAVIAPPRNWKDMKILDDLTRRALGLEDGEAKSNTIVQLQVVNDRLRSTMQNDILEGEIVSESVAEVSNDDDLQRELTGCQPAPPPADETGEGSGVAD